MKRLLVKGAATPQFERKLGFTNLYLTGEIGGGVFHDHYEDARDSRLVGRHGVTVRTVRTEEGDFIFESWEEF